MKRMLEKLYYGELYSNEGVLPRGKEFEQVNSKFSRLEEEFISR